MQKKLLCFCTVLFFALLLVLPAQADETDCSVSLPISQTVTGSRNITVSYTLSAEAPNAPMPEGSVNGIYQFTLTGNQTLSLPPIRFTDSGEWKYNLSAKADSGEVTPKLVRISAFVVSVDGDLIPMIVAEQADGQKIDLSFKASSGGSTPSPSPTPSPGSGSGKPKTGDSQQVGWHLTWMLISLIGSAVLLGILRQKRQRN